MKPYPNLPGVPAAGHVSGGYWHPGPITGCPKCAAPAPARPRTHRPATVRDLGSVCPRCAAGLNYTTAASVLLVRCPDCGYRRSLAWDSKGRITTYDQEGSP